MRSFADMKRKLNERTWLLVENSEHDTTGAFMSRLLTEFPMNFIKYYLIRRHCTGGLTGLRYASIQASFRFLKIYRIWRSGSLRTAPSGSITTSAAREY